MLNRFNGNVVPFAIDSTATNRTVFGDTAQSDDIDDNLNADFKKGWEIVGINDNPTKQDFNALAYTLGNLVSYLYQQGIATWNTTQEYFVGSRVIGSDGLIYKALTGTESTPNEGNDPTTDTVNWEADNAVDIFYDNTDSGLTAENVQEAIDELTSGKALLGGSATQTFKVADAVNDDEAVAKLQMETAIAGVSVDVSSSAEIRTGTDNTKAVTPLGINETQLGWGQTWQDVRPSRDVGVTYTNTTGKPIEVNILHYGAIGDHFLLVDGLTVSKYNRDGVDAEGMLIAVVPNGSTYQHLSPGTPTQIWAELR
jgi:hypothetical protein